MVSQPCGWRSTRAGPDADVAPSAAADADVAPSAAADADGASDRCVPDGGAVPAAAAAAPCRRL